VTQGSRDRSHTSLSTMSARRLMTIEEAFDELEVGTIRGKQVGYAFLPERTGTDSRSHSPLPATSFFLHYWTPPIQAWIFPTSSTYCKPRRAFDWTGIPTGWFSRGCSMTWAKSCSCGKLRPTVKMALPMDRSGVWEVTLGSRAAASPTMPSFSPNSITSIPTNTIRATRPHTACTSPVAASTSSGWPGDTMSTCIACWSPTTTRERCRAKPST